MTNRLRKYFAFPWPQIVFLLVSAGIFVLAMEPHPMRYAIAGFLVLLAGIGIILNLRGRRSRRSSQEEKRNAEFKSDDET